MARGGGGGAGGGGGGVHGRPARRAHGLPPRGVRGQAPGAGEGRRQGHGRALRPYRAAGGHPIPPGQRFLLLHRQRGPERGAGAERRHRRGHALPAAADRGRDPGAREELAHGSRTGQAVGLHGHPPPRRIARPPRPSLGLFRAATVAAPAVGRRVGHQPRRARHEPLAAPRQCGRLAPDGGCEPGRVRPGAVPCSPDLRRHAVHRSPAHDQERARNRSAAGERPHQRGGHPPRDPGHAAERLRVPDRGRGHLLDVPQRRAGQLVRADCGLGTERQRLALRGQRPSGTKTATWW